jgi:hypothetical protein
MFDPRACTLEISTEVDFNLGNILWVSKNASEFFNRTNEELMSMKIEMLMPP